MTKPETAEREPWSPNFRTQAEYLLAGLPASIQTNAWHGAVETVAARLQTAFVEGMQEAKERIKHDPSLGI